LMKSKLMPLPRLLKSLLRLLLIKRILKMPRLHLKPKVVWSQSKSQKRQTKKMKRPRLMSQRRKRKRRHNC